MNKKALFNKISTAWVVVAIASLVSLSGLLNSTYQSITNVYWYGSSWGSISSANKEVFTLKNDSRVKTWDEVYAVNETENSSSENNWEVKWVRRFNDKNDKKGIKITGEARELKLNLNLKDKLKKKLGINDEELAELIDTDKNDKSINKEKTKRLINFYIRRKIERQSREKRNNNSKGVSVNKKSPSSSKNKRNNKLMEGNMNNNNLGNADINIYPDILPQTWV